MASPDQTDPNGSTRLISATKNLLFAYTGIDTLLATVTPDLHQIIYSYFHRGLGKFEYQSRMEFPYGCPGAIFIDSKGHIYLAHAKRVEVWDANRNLIKTIGAQPPYAGPADFIAHFDSITRIFVDRSDNLYVSELNGSGESRVHVLNSQGLLIHSLTPAVPKKYQFGRVAGLAVDRDGNPCVASDDGQILIYPPRGRGKKAPKPIRSVTPIKVRNALRKSESSVQGIACDPRNGNFLVALPSQIYVCDPHGKSVQVIGKGELQDVKGLKVEEDGTIIVWTDTTVEMWTPEGERVLCLGEGKTRHDEDGFQSVHGVAVDAKGNFIICDPGSSRMGFWILSNK